MPRHRSPGCVDNLCMHARRTLEDHERAMLVRLLQRYPIGRTVELRRGSRLAQAGERTDHLWVVVDGSVRWVGIDPRGRQRVVIALGAPTTVGLAELLVRAPFSCDVEAESEVRAFTVGADMLRSAMTSEPRVAQGLLEGLARLAMALARAEAEQHLDIETRLAAHLLEVGRRHGQPGPKGMLLRQPLTEQDLSDTLGTVPRSIRRVLAKWRQRGWVERHKGWLVLARPQNLAALHEPPTE